jgi:hypothetical protein
MNPLPEMPGRLVYMRCRSAWAYIDGIREFGQFFFEHSIAEVSVPERVTMIIQETLENAIKYSVRTADAEVDLSLAVEDDFFVVTVGSTPSPEHLGVLREELAILNAQSPEDAYVAAFARAASDENAGSRIGLARVRLEGNAELCLDELANGRITITARGPLGAKPNRRT